MSVLPLFLLQSPLPFPSTLPRFRPSHNVIPSRQHDTTARSQGGFLHRNFFTAPAAADRFLWGSGHGNTLPVTSPSGDDDSYFMIVRSEREEEQNGKGKEWMNPLGSSLSPSPASITHGSSWMFQILLRVANFDTQDSDVSERVYKGKHTAETVPQISV